MKKKEMWIIIITCAFILIFILGAAGRTIIQDAIEFNSGHCRECGGTWKEFDPTNNFPQPVLSVPLPGFGEMYFVEGVQNYYHIFIGALDDDHYSGYTLVRYIYKCNRCGRIILLQNKEGRWIK